MWKRNVVGLLLLIGVAYCFAEPRIINGTDANIENYPYMVSLRLGRKHWCGGSIINSRWILTAAHCVKNLNPNILSIQYGVSDVEPDGPNIVQVMRKIVHKDFINSIPLPNDIALLELAEELNLNNKTIAAVRLPPQNYEVPQTPEGSPGDSMGWGETADYTYPRRLQEVRLKIYSDLECHQRINLTSVNNICAGVDEGGKSACRGDSGGPLVRIAPEHERYQVGIVSFGPKTCAEYPRPGVYTKVSHYIDWIYEHIN